MIQTLGGNAPINLIYSVGEVSDEDIDYFISSFQIRDKKLRENYLQIKETIMGLGYRFGSYSEAEGGNYKKKQIDLLLLKWESWFVKAIEASKGVKELKKVFLKKKQFDICGLELPKTRSQELIKGYQAMVF